MATEERKYTAKDLYIASIVGELLIRPQAGTREESFKKAVGTGRNVAQDELKVADFDKQFDGAMKALDAEEGRAAQQ
jgi:hypothetical protein